MKEKMIENSQHAFTKGLSCLTNLIAFCDKMAGSVDEGRALDVIYLDFSRAFNTLFQYNILVSKLGYYSLDGWTPRWV